MIQDNFTILIVDDNPKNLQVLGNTLKGQNYKVEFAIDGAKALDWIGKHDFDLILLDVMMPEIDGFEVCETIRKNKKYENLPIIFLTAKTDTEGIVKGFEVGAQDYITKPFNTAELLIRVKTQLELKEGREKLQSVNKWLETEVKKRTKELEESNEQLEKANKELLSLDKTKTDFLNTISNELRGPLNGIMGTLHILKDQADSKEMVTLINVLDDSVNRLEKYSNLALYLTSLKTGKYTLVPKSVNLGELVDLSLVKVADLLKEKQPKFENTISDNLTVKGDYDLLLMIFEIVLETSLQRLTGEGVLQIDAKSEKNTVTIEIKDNGMELPAEILSENFDTYKASPDYPAKDIGPGFNLVKLIAEKHSGKFTIRQADKLTTLELKLPAE